MKTLLENYKGVNIYVQESKLDANVMDDDNEFIITTDKKICHTEWGDMYFCCFCNLTSGLILAKHKIDKFLALT